VTGYAATDKFKPRFTGKERDAESGLDHFGARYFAAAQGRCTSPDKPFADQKPADPQSWNLYAYVSNNPLKYVDPDGEEKQLAVYVWQPVPGQRIVRQGISNCGHAFIGLRDTDARTENKVGLYPRNKLDLLADRTANVSGIIKSDRDSDYNVETVYTITDEQYDLLTKDTASQSTKSGAPQYNMVTSNCAAWVVTEAAKVGVTLPQTKTTESGRTTQQNKQENPWGLALPISLRT
jgi:RHS repeat-associated protein